ncbi:MAG: S8 family serine peptidase [Candidatus Nanopelagicales bacterium]
MSMSETRTRKAVPTRFVAAAAALAVLAVPVPASAEGPSRTALLSLTGETSLSALAQSVQELGGRVLSTLEVADSLLVQLPRGVAAPFGAAEVPDTPMRVNGTRMFSNTTVPTYRETVGASADLNAGAGVTVALLDTGVAADADGLGHVQHVNVTDGPAGDGLGHGTFQAGLIAGRGTFPGVAPGADLVDVQVADAQGNTSLSTVLAGLDAVADRGDVDVLNVSLSTDSPLPPSFDPLSRALERLWARGVTVVVAAGNDGPDRGTVSSPGDDPMLLTVGSLDEQDTTGRRDDDVAEFSARPDRRSKGKPDLLAPGVSLVSTSAPGSSAVTENPNAVIGDGYMRGSGTSMSAAIVSGAVAAVLDVNPGLEPNGVKALLTRTAYNLKGRDAGEGDGGLDLAAAVAKAPRAPAEPRISDDSEDFGDWGPRERDADKWETFAAAWESGDFDAVQAAWGELSWQTKQWAGRAWMSAVLADSMDLSKDDFEARSWSARSWSVDDWLARSWSARSWSARSWSFEEWLARSWSARSWSARSWSARSWSTDEWLARSWSARSWSNSDWAARSWSARSWSARSWSARSWSDFAWEARSWSTESWTARSWSMDA